MIIFILFELINCDGIIYNKKQINYFNQLGYNTSTWLQFDTEDVPDLEIDTSRGLGALVNKWERQNNDNQLIIPFRFQSNCGPYANGNVFTSNEREKLRIYIENLNSYFRGCLLFYDDTVSLT